LNLAARQNGGSFWQNKAELYPDNGYFCAGLLSLNALRTETPFGPALLAEHLERFPPAVRCTRLARTCTALREIGSVAAMSLERFTKHAAVSFF
jgi:hypothetical protein